VITDNGDVVELTPESLAIVDKIPAGIDLVDAARSSMVSDSVLKERQRLAEDGLVVVSATLGTDGTLVARPQVSVRAVARNADNRNLEDMLRSAVEQAAAGGFKEYVRPAEGGQMSYDTVAIRTALERTVRQICRELLQSHPLIQVLLQSTAPAAASVEAPAIAAPETAPTSPGLPRRRRAAAAAANPELVQTRT